MLPALNHIKDLVSTLNRENAETHTRTIKQLLGQGDEAKIFYLSSLFDEIDWKDRSPRDNQKILNLREEISQTLKLPNFVTLLCQAYESGQRQRIFQTLPILPEEFGLVNVSSILSLSVAESVAFAFALMHSQLKSVAIHATMYFKGKLPEITSFRELNEETTHSMIHLSISENMYPPELTKRILDVMRSSYPPQNPSLNQNPNVNVNPSLNLNQSQSQSQSQSVPNLEGERKLQSRPGVSRTLNEIGFNCSRTPESFRHTLYTELELTSLDEVVVVDVLFSTLIPRSSSGLEPVNPEVAGQLLNMLLSGNSSPLDNQIEWWSVEVVLNVLSEDCRSLNINWTNVLRALDRVTSPYLPTEAEFVLFLKFLSRVMNRLVPAAGLLPIWENRSFQLSCIGHAANAPRMLIDFSDLITPSSRLDAGPEVPIPIPPNGSWLCVHLYSTLLTIASRGNNNEVMKLLADAAIQYPEYVFLGLAQTTDQNSGVRTELLRRLIRYFTGLNGSRPSSGAVMTRLYEVNQDLLVLILRISLKNSTTVQEIMNIDGRLKNFGNSNGNNVLLYRIQEECTLDEILPYWCVIADYQRGPGSLHLEERLLSILVKNPSYARNIVLFAKAHIDTLRPRMMAEGSSGILSYENFVTILKCAQQYPTIVSTQDVRTLAGLANQRQQQQLAQSTGRAGPGVGAGAGGVDGNAGPSQGISNPSLPQLPPQSQTSSSPHPNPSQMTGGYRVGGQSQSPSVSSDQSNSNISRSGESSSLSVSLGAGSLNAAAGGVGGGGVGPSALPSAIPGVAGGNVSSSSAPSSASSTTGSGSSEEIEEIANSYFQRIYTSNMTINDVIVLLKRFKTSSEPREQEIFRCMIHNLFDEYRFFHKYPDKELQLTGRLFGTLIQHQLVATITLGIALRYVLEALRKDPEQGGSNEKMFRFGKIALEQFRSRLGEWPQYCSHLVQIPHLSRHCGDLFREAQRAISNPGSNPPANVNATANANVNVTPNPPANANTNVNVNASAAAAAPLALPATVASVSTPQAAVQSSSSNSAIPTVPPVAVPVQSQNQRENSTTSVPVPSQSSTSSTSANNTNTAAASAVASSPQISSSISSSETPLSKQPTSTSTATAAAVPVPVPVASVSAPIAVPAPTAAQVSVPVVVPPTPVPVVVTPVPVAASPAVPALNTNANLNSNTNTNANAFSADSTYEIVSQAQVRATAHTSIEDQHLPSSLGDSSSLSADPNSSSFGDDFSNVPEERRRKAIERMYAVNMEAPEVHIPTEVHRDQILFIINNIAKSNVEAKTKELKGILDVAHYNWFANYLIVKRISTQPNLHSTYIAVIDLMDSSLLVKAIMLSGYHNVTKLLQSSKITNSSSERSLLRNLGVWLGQLTLSRNKPLLQRRCDLKELLLWGYEDGRLIAVCSFVAKILEGCKDSKIFRPPNPWLMSILGVMRELYEVEDLKMNIKFEVQVLCKNIGVKIDDIPKTNTLSQCFPPIKEKNPDFNVRLTNPSSLTPSSSSSPTPQITSPQFVMNQGTPLQSGSSHPGSGFGLMMIPPAAVSGVGGMPIGGDMQPSQSDEMKQQDLTGGSSLSNLPISSDQIVIPNLASHVIVNQSLYYLLPGANASALLRRIVPLAVDKAILEIILPVVERCVTMACMTTQHLVLKDFAQEPNEMTLRKASHQMISNLAGSLALVTCKEPLRVSISNHLRSLLSGTNIESSVVDQIVQKCSSDNLDLGCMLIEKAATERAIRDMDEALAGPIKLRKKHMESGAAANTFSDTTSLSAANITNVITKGVPGSGKYPRDLPDSMKAMPGGLTPSQLHVYDGFHRQKLVVPSSNTDSGGVGSGPQGQSPSPHSMSPSPQPLQASQSMANANLSMSQSLEAYQVSLSRVDNSLKTVMIQAQGRDVSLSMLGGDHEIVSRLREIMHITQCTQSGVRIESALTFAESVFKRLVETVGVNDTLRLEVMVGILEALRDACGGSRKFIPDITGWLNAYATFSVAEEGSRKVLRDILTLLMRAKLLSAAEVDLYFANNLEAGRNMLWVEMSLAFIRHSLAEGLAATYEYSKVFDIVAQMRPSHPTVRKSLQKWLTDIRTLAAAREEQRSSSSSSSSSSLPGAGGAPIQSTPSSASASVVGGPSNLNSNVVGGSSPSSSQPTPSSNLPPSGVSLPPVPPVRDHARDQVVGLLDQWLRVWQVSDDKIFGKYLQLLHQHGVLKTEEAADKFFRLSVEICVEACLKSGQNQSQNQNQSQQSFDSTSATATSTVPSSISYSVMDALSKLFLLLIRLADKEASDSSVRINLLGRILNAGARVLVEDHEGKKGNPASAFDQRPYYRLFANLMQDLGVLDSKQQMQDPNQSFLSLLGAYSQLFLALQPSSVPGFAFSWLQLISHRCFMPHLLQGRGPIPRSSLPPGTAPPKITSGWPYMHRLLLVLLHFLQPFLRTAQLIDPIRRLYKGTLKVLLVLLHDFPEFLADYHLSLCEAIPPPCVQLRNLVLSAFPRSMRLPDPFTPNLKIDLLPEITHSPRILTDFIGILNERGLRPRLDSYLSTKQPLDFPEQLLQALMVNSVPVGGGSLHPLLTVCVVMYAASYGISQLQQKISITQGAPMDIWRHIVTCVDPESRYAFLNILGNQLRFPNSHTHYFSCVLLNLFAESTGVGGEIIQEQITRVLLERLIVHRPHPWGLLVSFIELIKNPRYNFWSRPFVKCAPEIEKVFESVSRSCNGPSSTVSGSGSGSATTTNVTGGVNGGVGNNDSNSK